MEFLGKISLIIHVIAGASTLITGPMAIFYNFKDPRKHRIVGKIFFYAMLVVAISSIGGYLKRPDSAFYQFLLGLAVLVLAGIFRGVRSIFLMKGDAVQKFDWAYTIALGINGLWMLGMGAWHFQQGTMVAIPILFTVFGSMCLMDVRQNWRVFSLPAALHRFDWNEVSRPDDDWRFHRFHDGFHCECGALPALVGAVVWANIAVGAAPVLFREKTTRPARQGVGAGG